MFVFGERAAVGFKVKFSAYLSIHNTLLISSSFLSHSYPAVYAKILHFQTVNKFLNCLGTLRT